MIDDERLYREVGKRVRQLRERQEGKSRMTQAHLAELVGLERTSITNIERGNQKLPLHVLYRICEALKCPISDTLPALTELQGTADSLTHGEILFGSNTTPLVKKAILDVLNRSQ